MISDLGMSLGLCCFEYQVKGCAGLHIKPNKALTNRASGVNKLLALIGGLVALKFCLLKDHTTV